jgi:hypothetical protein
MEDQKEEVQTVQGETILEIPVVEQEQILRQLRVPCNGHLLGRHKLVPFPFLGALALESGLSKSNEFLNIAALTYLVAPAAVRSYWLFRIRPEACKFPLSRWGRPGGFVLRDSQP